MEDWSLLDLAERYDSHGKWVQLGGKRGREIQCEGKVKCSTPGNSSTHKHMGCKTAKTANSDYKAWLHTEAQSQLIQSSHQSHLTPHLCEPTSAELPLPEPAAASVHSTYDCLVNLFKLGIFEEQFKHQCNNYFCKSFHNFFPLRRLFSYLKWTACLSLLQL